MLNNFPTTKPIVNYGLAIAVLLNVIAGLVSLYTGDYRLAISHLSTIIAVVVISLIIHRGYTQGWNDKTWRLVSLVMFVSVIGYALLRYLNS